MRALVLTLLLTTPALPQFQILPTPTTADLRGIHAVSPEIAWASGTNGAVLRTTDAGAHWALCPTPPNAEHLDFRGIQAFDAQTAIVMSSGKGDLSRLYKTTDACATWTLLFTNPDPEGFWDAIKFDTQTKQFGSLIGDPVAGYFPVFVTFDQGDRWEKRLILPKAEENESLFAASNSSLSVLAPSFNSAAFVTGGPKGARLITLWVCIGGEGNCFELGDFGPIKPGDPNRGIGEQVYWQPESLPLPKSDSGGAFSLSRVIRSNSFVTVIVGGDFKQPGSTQGNAVYWSSGHWLPAQTPPHGYRSSVANCPNLKTWITVGPNGTDISTDDGRNWRPLHPNPALNEPADADKNWNALSLPYVVGPHGRIGKLHPLR